MSTESSYYTELTTNSALSSLISSRVYPIKLPQNTVYPCLCYRVDEAVVEGTLKVNQNPSCFYTFENILYAESYSKLIELTDCLRDICTDMDWNIDSFVDMEFDSEISVYSRNIRINVNSIL